MKKLALYIIMVLALASTIVACNNNEPQAELLAVESLTEDKVFHVGDVFADLTVTATDGNTYTISELLEEKEIVVLNFWYINCGPCQMEFPYLQEAYEQYSDRIEVLAVNTVDGTDEEIAAFAEKYELTFPMAKLGSEWDGYVALTGYPTTIIIDGDGTVAYMHTGMFTSTEEFVQVFEKYLAEVEEQKGDIKS